MKIAVCHPGKIGDALYALPTIRHISKLYNCKIDFYTSEHCVPILKFMEQQDCINRAFVSRQYKIERYDMGVQPWYVPVDDEYDQVFQLGFKSVPDKSLPEYIAEQAGFTTEIGKDIQYQEVEPISFPFKFPYYVIAPRGETSFSDFFREFIKNSKIPCIVVGSYGDNCFNDSVIDYTGCSFNDMAYTIKNSSGYLGIMSGPLVIANGFNVKKYIPYTDAWDMRHIVNKSESLYSKNPSSNECCDWFDSK